MSDGPALSLFDAPSQYAAQAPAGLLGLLLPLGPSGSAAGAGLGLAFKIYDAVQMQFRHIHTPASSP